MQHHVGPAEPGQGPVTPAGVARVREAHGRRTFDQGPSGSRDILPGTLIEQDRRRQRAVTQTDLLLFTQPGQIVDKQAVLLAPEAANRGGLDLAGPLVRAVGLRTIAHGPGQGRQGVAQHGRRVQIEGALLVTLLPIGVVVDPDIGYAQVLDGQKAVLIAERGQVSRETHQARINLGHRRPVSGFQVVVPGVEVEPDAVVQQRAPKGSVDLPLRHAGQAIERRPAIEEVALGRQAFAEGCAGNAPTGGSLRRHSV